MFITGVDLGLGKMGICSISFNSATKFKKDDIVMMDTFTVNATKAKSDKKAKFVSFILQFHVSLRDILLKSDFVVVEKPFGLRGSANVLLELLGVVKFFCIVNNISFVEVSPMTLKKFATGQGKAQKSDMVLQAYKEFNFQGRTEDETDAFWLSLFGDCIKYQDKYNSSRQNIISKFIGGAKHAI